MHSASSASDPAIASDQPALCLTSTAVPLHEHCCRRAAEVARVHGKLTCLLINDLDAGIGHFANTQLTVNNQVVVGTLVSVW